MWNRIWTYGLIAGAIVGVQLALAVLIYGENPPSYGAVIGYLTMLVAMSLVFLAVKRRRDVDLGGTIRFLPALGMGLAISLIASVVYAAAWEGVLAFSGMDYAALYAEKAIETAKADGASAEEIARLSDQMASFADMYSNPMIRFGITMVEMLPVGVVVSLISALLLRNSRFLPARRAG